MNTSNLGELTVGYKYNSSLKGRPKISNSKDAYKVLKNLYDRDKLGLHEQFVVIYLNHANMVIGTINLFTGTTRGIMIDNKIVVGIAINLMASSVIISHNHPSGSLKPSESDLKLTRSMGEALELMSIKLLDHLIISPDEEYLSLVENGSYNLN